MWVLELEFWIKKFFFVRKYYLFLFIAAVAQKLGHLRFTSCQVANPPPSLSPYLQLKWVKAQMDHCPPLTGWGVAWVGGGLLYRISSLMFKCNLCSATEQFDRHVTHCMCVKSSCKSRCSSHICVSVMLCNFLLRSVLVMAQLVQGSWVQKAGTRCYQRKNKSNMTHKILLFYSLQLSTMKARQHAHAD